jgi:hypothetical protein
LRLVGKTAWRRIGATDRDRFNDGIAGAAAIFVALKLVLFVQNVLHSFELTLFQLVDQDLRSRNYQAAHAK